MQSLRILQRAVVIPCRTHSPAASSALLPSTSCIRHQGNAPYSTSPTSTPSKGYKFVVVGGGTGGLAMASWLCRNHDKGQVAVVEPANEHYYQPMWTLVGGGIKTKEQSMKPMSDVMPPSCDWLQDSVSAFDPDNNTVKLSSGDNVQYDYLVVAMGMQLNFDQLKGLPEALENDPMVCCNYSYKTVDKTFEALKNFKAGNAIFTFPSTPVKCAGAPQKIMYLAEEYFTKNNKRQDAKIMYNSPLPGIFGAPKYAKILAELCKERGIEVNLKTNLIEIKHKSKEAVFARVGTEPLETFTVPYEMIHVPPPMGSPDAIKSSPIAGPSGFVAVNKETGQHTKYPNIFGIGDCTDIPTSKTAAAAAAQSGMLRETMSAVFNGLTPVSKYDGYTSCPLVTGYNKCILAEFDFNLDALETFPFDQGKERRSMYHLKADLMPQLYWNGMLKGIWGGPGPYRKAMHLGMSK